MRIDDTEKLHLPGWRLRAFVRQNLGGQCKVISLGAECQCALCDLERMYDALRWYGDEAAALAANMTAKRDMAVLASVQVLALDAGKRTDDLVGPNAELRGGPAVSSPERPA